MGENVRVTDEDSTTKTLESYLVEIARTRTTQKRRCGVCILEEFRRSIESLDLDC